MTEVAKRDAQAKIICKKAAYIEKITDSTTLDEINDHCRELENAWNQYKTFHAMVMNRCGASELDEQTLNYEQVHESYEAALVRFKAEINRRKQMSTNQSASTSQPRLAARHSVVARVIINIEHTVSADNTLNPIAAPARLRELDSLYSQYGELCLDAMQSSSDCEAAILIESQSDVRNSYIRSVAVLQEVINNAAVTSRPAQLEQTEIKIAALDIGTFDGSKAKWESFRESFEQAFHRRQSMPPVQKLQHLKACLRGDAEDIVANFSLTNDNYEAAWKLLKQRYDNPFELMRVHLRTLKSLNTCKESAADLRKMLNRTSSTLLALRNLNRPVQYWDDWIVDLIADKFDAETRRMWEYTNCGGNVFPTWAELERFIENRIRVLDAVAPTKSASHATNNNQQSRNVRAHAVTSAEYDCPSCGGNHTIYSCHQFRQLSVGERRAVASDKRLCFNCLSSTHMATNCRSGNCRFCNQAHNSLLHEEIEIERPTTSTNSMVGLNPSRIVLRSAIVYVQAIDGELLEFRALLDSCSESSFISERAVQALRLQKETADFDMSGIGESSCGKATHSVNAIIKSRINNFDMSVQALVIKSVTRVRRASHHEQRAWPHFAGLTLADPDYQHPDRVDLLIGSECYGWCLLPEMCKAEINDPVGQNSQFGWLISGPICEPSSEISTLSSNTVNVNFVSMNSRIDECLERFWCVEDVGDRRCKTVDEESCENKFCTSFSRDAKGRFHVRIPFRKQKPNLGESLRAAIQRQYQMERKFRSNENFASDYREFMADYLKLGHMKQICEIPSSMTQQHGQYYIPHHAVLKESSSTTKLRVVFDASRRSTNGLSLNEQMLPGPRLQDDLSTIVMRWRKHCIVFTADIQRMYRQIIIDEPDADYQRIVWRPNLTEPMQIFQLTTVTYGTTSAPYLAVKALQTLATMEKNNYPIGSEIALNDFYVDDVLTGFDDVMAALAGQKQLRQLLSSGGFELKKWTSNCSKLLDHLPNGYCECRIPLELNMDQHVKTLGIQWNPVTDTFSFKIEFNTDDRTVTKRNFLSDAARLYDPLGWLAPSIILVKIMFQKLWQQKLDWDDHLPASLASEWFEMRCAFVSLRYMRINRWIGSTSASKIHLHGFCDASVDAYAAAVYVRSTNDDGSTRVTLLCAKTKVAPLKTISLPRLELSGALLLSQLMQNVCSSMQFDEPETFCWTDSTIVLAWIKGSPSRWSVFVANRVADIQRHFPISHWQHVPSEDNPADCSSRGVRPTDLADHPLWWAGPPWLSLSSKHWPSQTDIGDTNEEKRSKTTILITTMDQSWNLKDKYSSYNRLIRITAYCIRFTRNSRNTIRAVGPLRHDELQASRSVWIKDAQQMHFGAELRCLRINKQIDRSSTLRSLNPTIHSDGLIHVGGRLINAIIIPEQTRTPIIIPRRCRLAELLVSDAHEHTLHGGPSLMLAKLRRQYWIIDGPKHVRQFVKKCNVCFRYNSSVGVQMMGVLPTARITPSRPFAHTAMDYSGAIMLRSSKGRGQHATKGYISVFVCLSTKAVHIEIVSDLTSAAFIAAYKRFTGRRGVCSDIYSDNATNYVGAATVFRNTERDLGFNNKVISSLEMMGTRWHFSPPLAPHFNGLAESAIRSVKYHIRRIIGETTLTYEELSTFMVQVECCLNSRPLYPLSSDPTDFAVLTPGHFLIGAPLNAVPEYNVLNKKPTALNRWMMVQQMMQRFWMQWSAEYLHTMQQRKKWQTEQTNFAVGDMVIIADDNRPPSSWALGRITDVHPGDDGSVRVVTVRTATQTMKRSIVKLARLPTQDAEQNTATDPPQAAK